MVFCCLVLGGGDMVSWGAFPVGLCVGGMCGLMGGAKVRDDMGIAQWSRREASRFPRQQPWVTEQLTRVPANLPSWVPACGSWAPLRS